MKASFQVMICWTVLLSASITSGPYSISNVNRIQPTDIHSISILPTKETKVACTGVFSEANGLVVMEAENTSSDYDLWVKKTTVADYKGSGHLEFTGNQETSGSPKSPLAYTFKINQAGLYRLIIRAHKNLQGTREDISNDGFLRIDPSGDFEAGPDPSVHATYSEMTENQKFFGGPFEKDGQKIWGTAERYDINNSHKFRDAAYSFKAGKTYTIYLSGRSKFWNVDRIMLFKTDQYSIQQARNEIKTQAESACVKNATNPPADPSTLQATAISETQIKVSWQDNSDNEDGFRLELSLDGGSNFSLLQDLAANATQYTHTGLSKGQEYCYRVVAYNTNGDSGSSNTACSRVADNPISDLPAAPTGLQATSSSDTQIQLTWKDNATNESGFHLDLSLDGGTNFSLLKELAPNTTTYSHEQLSADTEYCYRIRAFNAVGNSAYTSTVCSLVAETPAPGELVAPGDLKATAISSSEIELSWLDNSTGEEGFHLERKEEGGDFQRIVTFAADQVNYRDHDLNAATSYTYRLQAYTDEGVSEYSNEATATTLAEIKAYNLITPNGDGIQDVWQIDNLEEVENFSIQVFTNAGKLVYKSQRYETPWDGSRDGQVLPNGVYYYVIRIGSAKNTVSGYLTLIH